MRNSFPYFGQRCTRGIDSISSTSGSHSVSFTRHSNPNCNASTSTPASSPIFTPTFVMRTPGLRRAADCTDSRIQVAIPNSCIEGVIFDATESLSQLLIVSRFQCANFTRPVRFWTRRAKTSNTATFRKHFAAFCVYHGRGFLRPFRKRLRTAESSDVETVGPHLVNCIRFVDAACVPQRSWRPRVLVLH